MGAHARGRVVSRSLPLDVGRRGARTSGAEPGVPPGDVLVEPRPVHGVREVRASDLALDGQPGLATLGAATAAAGVVVDLAPAGVGLGRRGGCDGEAAGERHGGQGGGEDASDSHGLPFHLSLHGHDRHAAGTHLCK